jgi:preprotein translocase subunit SecA
MSELASHIEGLAPADLRAASASLITRTAGVSSLPDEFVAEALALAREAIRRATDSWPSDAQVLHAARMQAGHVVGVPVGDRRGPILILAAYLHCLVRASVHVVVVDNTLASSLANQMIGVMNLLGVTAAALSDSPDFAEDKAAYRADVVVGPSTRFCYDYLTDCLTLSPDELIQPSRRVAIVAEADVLLLDEATQLRIIGSDYVSDARQYERAKELASTAIRGVHYTYAPGTSRLNFTPTGLALIQESLGVTDLEELSLLRDVQHVYDAFIAKDSFQRGRDYQVRAGVVHPVPWLQRNLRYAAGILQAIEAKEDLFVSDENLAEARIRAGDYFRLYETLTGIASIPTGALAAELRQRYNIQVADNPDELQSGEVSVRRREWEHAPTRDAALVDMVAERHANHEPVVIATGSPESTAHVSQLLAGAKITHTILAPESEHSIADGMANLGRPDAVTITEGGTGRGHDIPICTPAGEPAMPITVVGVGISRSARIDRWLCALAANNGGGAGVTFFMLRRDHVGELNGKLWSLLPARLRRRADGSYLLPLENKILRQSQDELAGRAVKTRLHDDTLAAVERQHFDRITALRQRFLAATSPADEVKPLIDQAVREYLAGRPDMHEVGRLLVRFNLGAVPAHWANTTDADWSMVVDDVSAGAGTAYQRQEARLGHERMGQMARAVALAVIAKLWREHLVELDILMQRYAVAAEEPGSMARYETAAASRYATMMATFRQLLAQHVLDPETLGP